MDGSREWITVVECTCADNSILPPTAIYGGKGPYRGWFTEVDDQNRNLHTLLKAIWPTSWQLSGCRPFVNLVPVMKVEVHRQRRRRMCGVYEENVCLRSKRAREERVLSDYTSLVMRRYTGITLGFRSQGAEQFV